MKKLIMILLTLSVMLATVFASPMQILAAEDGNTVLVMKSREGDDPKEIEIDVTVEENAGVCGMLLSLDYDTSVFTLTGLEYGTALSSLAPIHTNTQTDEGYGIYPFKITYLGEENDTSTGTMMTLRFRVKDNAPDGNYTITLNHERNKDVTYLKDNMILTKNLLIDGAKITISGNKITNVDSSNDRSEQNGQENSTHRLWIPITLGGLALIGGCSLVATAIIKRNKTKKWKKI